MNYRKGLEIGMRMEAMVRYGYILRGGGLVSFLTDQYASGRNHVLRLFTTTLVLDCNP